MKILDHITLIHRELVGELSVEEAKLLNSWKNENEDNLATYEDMVEIWRLTSDYSAPKLNINVSNALDNQLQKIRQEQTKSVVESDSLHKESASSSAKVIKLRPYQWMMRIASALVVILAATFAFQNMNGGDSYNSGNQLQFVQLSDGSSIWLDKNSTLSVDKSFGESIRKVTLEGKAFFDIARDEAKPFIIDANEVDVQVLGTSFTIDANDDTPSVAVKSGRVEVKADEETKIITKGQQLEVTDNGTLTESEVNLNSDFTWTNKDLSFKDAPLSQVFADLSNHFKIEFVYKGGMDLGNCPFTSKSLANTTLEDVLNILELTYDMNIIRKSEKEIKLSRIKCRK